MLTLFCFAGKRVLAEFFFEIFEKKRKNIKIEKFFKKTLQNKKYVVLYISTYEMGKR